MRAEALSTETRTAKGGGMKNIKNFAIFGIAVGLAALTACGGGQTNPGKDTGQVTEFPDPGQGDIIPVQDILEADSYEINTVDAADIDKTEPAEDVIPDIPPETNDADVMDADIMDADSGEEVGEDIALPVCKDDRLKCTSEEFNDEGVCTHPVMPDYCLIGGKCWFRMQVDPKNQCRFCVPEESQTDFTPVAGTPCDDRNACTAPDTCDKNAKCIPGKAVNCNDHNICTSEKCDHIKGCVYTPFQAACDDHSVCTTGDHCENGKCTGSPVQTDDGNPCTLDGCDPKNGVFHTNIDGEICDDGFACTMNDQCKHGHCQGVANTCDDKDPCTRDICNETAGGCLHEWQYGACDDHNKCTMASFCNSEHKCVGNPIDCNDFNPCTKDSCNPETGCVHTPVDASCDDGDPCTSSDHCQEGVCKGTPLDCEDKNPCTKDFCDQQKGCQHIYSTGACDDNNACTQNDNCATGTCKGQPVDCNDNNSCTKDWCDPVLGCMHDPIDGLCNDSNPCTSGDHCQEGVCKGTPLACNDHDPCTDDKCADGACLHEPHYGACDDGNACTKGEECVDGLCTNGTKVDCNDHNVCTIDACDKKWGCVYTPTPGPCDDNSVCTVHDQCENGKCVGLHIDCDDNNQCTTDPCDPLRGCYHEPRQGKCNDHDICTTDDQCIEGACGGTPKYNDPVLAASTFTAGVSGNPGQGLDVDGNPSTCSPQGSCLQGIDNRFSTIAWLLNPGYTEVVGQGDLTIMLENRDAAFPENMSLYTGKRVDPACDLDSSECDVLFFDESINASCTPVGTLQAPVMTGVALTAGGPDSVVPIRLVFGQLQIPISLYMAKVRATAELDDQGHPQTLTGVLGGCIIKSDLKVAISKIPDNQFTSPYTKEVVSAYVDTYLIADIDRTGGNSPDCISAGFVFTMSRAHIRGHEAGK